MAIGDYFHRILCRFGWHTHIRMEGFFYGYVLCAWCNAIADRLPQ